MEALERLRLRVQEQEGACGSAECHPDEVLQRRPAMLSLLMRKKRLQRHAGSTAARATGPLKATLQEQTWRQRHGRRSYGASGLHAAGHCRVHCYCHRQC
jgi:hypothetical protein